MYKGDKSIVNTIERHRIPIDLFNGYFEDDIIGSFRVKTWQKPGDAGYLFKLDSYDKEIISKSMNQPLRKGMQIFRYETKIMFAAMRPFIVIDFKLKRPRAYFLTKKSIEDDSDIKFETKGELIEYAWVFEDSKDEFEFITDLS